MLGGGRPRSRTSDGDEGGGEEKLEEKLEGGKGGGNGEVGVVVTRKGEDGDDCRQVVRRPDGDEKKRREISLKARSR